MNAKALLFRTSLCLVLACFVGCGGSSGGNNAGAQQQRNLDQEPNDADHPVQLSELSTLVGTVNSASDALDVYLFTSPNTSSFDFILDGFGEFDLDLYLTDEEDILFESENNAGEVETKTVELTKDHPYGVFIKAFDTASEDANYRLQILPHSEAAPPVDDPGETGGGGTCRTRQVCTWVMQPPLGYSQCYPVYECD